MFRLNILVNRAYSLLLFSFRLIYKNKGIFTLMCLGKLLSFNLIHLRVKLH